MTQNARPILIDDTDARLSAIEDAALRLLAAFDPVIRDAGEEAWLDAYDADDWRPAERAERARRADVADLLMPLRTAIGDFFGAVFDGSVPISVWCELRRVVEP